MSDQGSESGLGRKAGEGERDRGKARLETGWNSLLFYSKFDMYRKKWLHTFLNRSCKSFLKKNPNNNKHNNCTSASNNFHLFWDTLKHILLQYVWRHIKQSTNTMITVHKCWLLQILKEKRSGKCTLKMNLKKNKKKTQNPLQFVCCSVTDRKKKSHHNLLCVTFCDIISGTYWYNRYSWAAKSTVSF